MRPLTFLLLGKDMVILGKDMVTLERRGCWPQPHLNRPLKSASA